MGPYIDIYMVYKLYIVYNVYMYSAAAAARYCRSGGAPAVMVGSKQTGHQTNLPTFPGAARCGLVRVLVRVLVSGIGLCEGLVSRGLKRY